MNRAGILIADYHYDALGRRVEKVLVAGTTTRYLLDGVEVVEEYDAVGNWQARYVYEDGIDRPRCMDRADIADVNGNQNTTEVLRFHYHQQALGSVTEVTQPTGAVVEWVTYDVYGLPTIRDQQGNGIAQSAIGSPYLFTGREYDPEDGLYFYRARAYDPQTGRFLQRDARGWVDGPCLYEYARSAPDMWRDPDGGESRSPNDPGGRPVTHFGPDGVPEGAPLDEPLDASDAIARAEEEAAAAEREAEAEAERKAAEERRAAEEERRKEEEYRQLLEQAMSDPLTALLYVAWLVGKYGPAWAQRTTVTKHPFVHCRPDEPDSFGLWTKESPLDPWDADDIAINESEATDRSWNPSKWRWLIRHYLHELLHSARGIKGHGADAAAGVGEGEDEWENDLWAVALEVMQAAEDDLGEGGVPWRPQPELRR